MHIIQYAAPQQENTQSKKTKRTTLRWTGVTSNKGSTSITFLYLRHASSKVINVALITEAAHDLPTPHLSSPACTHLLFPSASLQNVLTLPLHKVDTTRLPRHAHNEHGQIQKIGLYVTRTETGTELPALDIASQGGTDQEIETEVGRRILVRCTKVYWLYQSTAHEFIRDVPAIFSEVHVYRYSVSVQKPRADAAASMELSL